MTNLDQIYINNLKFYGTHGLFPEENKLGQRFYCDLIIYLPLKDTGLEDNRATKLDYIAVVHLVKEIVEKREYLLIETVAETIAKEVLEQFPLVKEITVKFTKPHPPYNIEFDGLGVKIHRTKNDYLE
ncbi:dihydroneopterin aldolase [Viridibacillus arvi]|uniref:dihydroneopterin aldolase n=1 Tax=Viridibacillus arvi TaxID=263475 RepID=UPI0034CD1327